MARGDAPLLCPLIVERGVILVHPPLVDRKEWSLALRVFSWLVM